MEQTEKKDNAEGENKPEEFNYNEYVNKIQEYILKGTNKPRIRFNPSIETRSKLVESQALEGKIIQHYIIY